MINLFNRVRRRIDTIIEAADGCYVSFTYVQATLDLVLIYGASDRIYHRMLGAILRISWRRHTVKPQLHS